MTTTTNLVIDHLEPNSDQPEVPINVALDALDKKTTGLVTIGFVGSSNVYTLSQAEQLNAMFVLTTASPPPGGAVTLNFIYNKAMGLFSVYNTTGFTATLRVDHPGSPGGQPLSAPTLTNGSRGIFQHDGTNVLKLV